LQRAVTSNIGPQSPSTLGRLLSFKEAPAYEQSNPYILTGYRGALSKWEALKSVLALHNESLNIWTHVFGMVAVLAVLWNAWVEVLPSEPLVNQAAFTISALVTLWTYFSSVIYHTLKCHSHDVYHCTLLMDYSGIISCVLGITSCLTYVGYRCYPTLRDSYVTVVILLSASLVLSFILPRVTPPTSYVNWHDIRTTILALFAAFGLIPLFHWIYLNGPYSDVVLEFAWRFVFAYILLGFGFFIWAIRFPEKYFLGKFDIFLASHQIWHVFVLACPLLLLHTELHMFAYDRVHPCESFVKF